MLTPASISAGKELAGLSRWNCGLGGRVKRLFTHARPAFCPISLHRGIRRARDGISNRYIIKEFGLRISAIRFGLAHALIISLGTFSKKQPARRVVSRPAGDRQFRFY